MPRLAPKTCAAEGIHFLAVGTDVGELRWQGARWRAEWTREQGLLSSGPSASGGGSISPLPTPRRAVRSGRRSYSHRHAG